MSGFDFLLLYFASLWPLTYWNIQNYRIYKKEFHFVETKRFYDINACNLNLL